MKTISILITIFLLCSIQAEAQCPLSNKAGVHTVQQNENLYRISVNYGVSVKQICEWNNMSVLDELILCDELIVAAYAAPQTQNSYKDIPTSYNHTNTNHSKSNYTEPIPIPDTYTNKGNSTYSNSSMAYRMQNGNKHTVHAGETVAGLAKLYGYTEERFREFNVLGNRELTPGSSVLSTDCSCPRVTYDEPNEPGYVRKNQPTGTIPTNYGNTTYTDKGSANQGNGNTGNQPKANPPGGKAAAGYMQSLELDMIDEINLMRSDPADYAKYVRAYAQDQRDNNGFSINQSVVDELINELTNSPKLSHLEPSRCIYTAAQKHGGDCLSMGSIEHKGSDGKWPWDRVLRECPSMTDGNENLVGGPDNVRESVIILLIDDGIPSRGHRKTLMRADWKYVACHKIGQVGIMPHCWVQKFGY